MDASFEGLGVFYLGRVLDAGGAVTAAPLLYDSRDLTTHAVCVGMTGSGKTGLCISLLEEAALDGIPAVVIDPKGDLANLMLSFPDLAPASFRPWVNEDAARQQGITPDELAAREAARWAQGLGEWGQDGARIRRMHAAADFAVYTPGSDAARPVSVLSSLAPPRARDAAGAELLAERASGVASSVLALLGVDADPMRSREHILLTNVLQQAWAESRPLDLAALVRAVQSPPFTRVGVMELESFMPAKERFALAMLLNNLLASPSFQPWLEGEALDVDAMLYTGAGKPRVAIFSIAHLDDARRMFFVSLLLNEVVAWTRTRPGTSSLRALVYMDEIFGFLPPVENPPSKQPLLTLMKQARAFGVGVVLATQNPVDLDYKALSNAGTWFIGRLQTERDKKRLADGLAGAAGTIDVGALQERIGKLEPRAFLMHNVHEDAPVLFKTRWALSYLAGPLTRAQLRMLPRGEAVPAAGGARLPAQDGTAATANSARPVLASEVAQLFERAPSGGAAAYTPVAMGEARVHIALPDGSAHPRDVLLEVPLHPDQTALDWSAARERDRAPEADAEPVAGAAFAPLPAHAGSKGSAALWSKALADAIYRGPGITLYESRRLREVSRPGESERDFRVRIADVLRADRDARVEKLRAKYAAKLAALEGRIRTAEAALEREKDQAVGQHVQTAVSLGTTLLSAFLGRKAVSRGTLGRATSAARGAGRAAEQQRDVGRARENVHALRARLGELNAALEREIGGMETAGAGEITARTLRPKRSDIEVRRVAILWRPR